MIELILLSTTFKQSRIKKILSGSKVTEVSISGFSSFLRSIIWNIPMYLINIHEDFMTSYGDLNFFKEYLNVQNLTICNKNLLCLNDFTFFDY